MAGRRASEERQEKEEERVIGVRRREDKGRLSTAPLTARSSAPRPYCRIWIEVHILPVGGASVCRIWTTLRRRACVRACVRTRSSHTPGAANSTAWKAPPFPTLPQGAGI